MYVAGSVKALYQHALKAKGTKLKLKVFVCLFKTPRHAEGKYTPLNLATGKRWSALRRGCFVCR